MGFEYKVMHYWVATASQAPKNPVSWPYGTSPERLDRK